MALLLVISTPLRSNVSTTCCQLATIYLNEYLEFYDNWAYPFCNTVPESLQHFLTCSSLEQSWIDITLSIYTHLQQTLIKLKTRHVLPTNQVDFYLPSRISPQSTFCHLANTWL